MRFPPRCLRWLLAALLCAPWGQFAARAADAAEHPLLAAERVLWLGDSITADGRYVALVETWLALHDPQPPHVINAGLPSETVSGLSEPGHAGGKFPRPDLHERLQRVLEKVQPDLVIACYGMNCGVYQPLDETRFAAYRDGMARLAQAAQGAGAKLALVTPPCYDDDTAPREFSYDDVLGHYSNWLVAQRDRGWTVVDLHAPMSAERRRRRAADATFTFQPDGVHPNLAGHWCMAQQLLAWLGESRATSWDSPAAMLQAHGAGDELLSLVVQRMGVLRDAYVAAAGHQRPGVPAGMPLDEAERRAAELTARIALLCRVVGQR